jgi:formylmethanofuran dehydrogenase subunit C
MTGRRITERKASADIPTLEIGGRFGRYGKEEEKAIRGQDIREDQVVSQLIIIWRAFGPQTELEMEKVYDDMSAALSGVQYTPEHVEKFSLALAESLPESISPQNEITLPFNIGLFLSALINNGKDDEYTIHTKGLAVLPQFLGSENRKKIIVKGDGGEYLGSRMEGGSITVEGDVEESAGIGMKGGAIIIKNDAGYRLGYHMNGGMITVEGNCGERPGGAMKGGIILIKGDAGDTVGDEMEDGEITVIGSVGKETGRLMRGGKIIIKGDAGSDLGHVMKGGEIHVEGSIESIGEVESGRIYHRGELIAGEEEAKVEVEEQSKPWWRRAWDWIVGEKT